MSRAVFAFGVRRAPACAIGLACGLVLTPSAGAEVIWSVTFDQAQSIAPFVPSIASALLAAGAEWSRYIDGSARLDVQVVVDWSIPRSTGASVTTDYLFDNGIMTVWDQGAASEVRTGVDPNGASADIQIRLSPTYLANELWFDSDPTSRTEPVPTNRTDAVSVFMHEIGHALGFNGWRNQTTSAIGGYGSTFDALTTFDGSNFYFNGPEARAEYGAAVPLTYGNIFHVGNFSGRPGTDLRGDLLNGVVFNRGTRYDISRLDLAILSDLGLPVVYPDVPTPGAIACLGLAGFATMARRRRSN